jgi:hypothetical protein
MPARSPSRRWWPGSDAAGAAGPRARRCRPTPAGRLDIDEAVFASERATGHRNRAIGHLLRNHGILPGAPEPALELYFKQCSLRVDCRDLALMAPRWPTAACNPVTRPGGGAGRVRRAHPQRDDHLRHVRLLRRWVLPHRPAGQERRGRRHHRRAAGAAGHRRVVAAAGRTWQQRARRAGLRDGLARPGLHSCRRRAPRCPRCAPATTWPACGPSAGAAPPTASGSMPTAAARRSSSCRATCVSRRSSRCCATSSTALRRGVVRRARLQARRAGRRCRRPHAGRAGRGLCRARPATGADARAPRRPAGRLRRSR